MIQILQQVLTILTTPPGNLAYHLIAAFVIAIVLQAAFIPWRARGLPQGRRMVIGLTLLLVVRFVTFISALLAGQNLGVPDVLFPILDRAVTALSLAIIIWLWAFPDTLRPADAATLLLSLLTVTLAIFTFIWWSNQGLEAFFNTTLPDTAWEAFSLFLLLLGAIALFVRRPLARNVGLVMLLFLAIGHVTHLLVPLQDSDYPAAVRLLQLIAYPLLFFLPQRFSLLEPAPSQPQMQAVIPDRRRYSLSPKAFASFLTLATETNPQEICQAIARSVSEALLADICLLVAPPDQSGDMAIECGYDLIREEFQYGGFISSQQVPMLATALQRGRNLRLPATSASQDLTGLSQALNISRSGPLLAVPIFTPEDEIIVAVVLLSPYSNRSWTPEDQSYLLGLSKSLGAVILDSRNAEISPGAPSQESIQSTIAALQAENQHLQHTLDQVQAGAQAPPGELEQLQGELRLTLEELAYLRNDLAEADEKIAALEKSAPLVYPPGASGESNEVITSIAQELRQPMSSLIGYTDLLLSESAGILGALQRKFVERIKVSTERIGALAEDLIQVTSLDSGQVELAPELVDLNQVIQEAVDQTAAQLETKDLHLNLDLPDDLPQVHADRDALQQAMLHLVQNAASATPEEGQVSLRVRLERAENKQDFVLLQVTDQGGGIPPGDLPRVFSRLYRADNALIQGVGDTGVGLSIVKQLIEAHGGRIWVDTDLGHGSIFSLLLPVNEAATSAGEGFDGRGLGG